MGHLVLTKPLIIATTSPHRLKALQCLGIPFGTEASNVDEYQKGRPEDAEEIVLHLSRLKAEAVAKNHPRSLVLGMDSVGAHRGIILEKPKSKEEAFSRLSTLSGRSHHFYTGITLLDSRIRNPGSSIIVHTQVFMRPITDKEIDYYLSQDSNFNTFALGYDPLNHYSATFIRRIEGSYTNLLYGCPLEEIIDMLAENERTRKPTYIQ